MKYQFQIDNRAAGRIRDTWREAATDAVNGGYGTWTDDGNVKLDPQASIYRVDFVQRSDIFGPSPCLIRQAGDSTWCATPKCGLRWDTNDDNPPQCPRRSAVQRLSRQEVGEAQKRLAALYSEPAWPLARILWAIVAGTLFVAGVACVVIGIIRP